MNGLLDFFKVVSDEMRLRILILLSKEELCGCEICAILNLPQPKVSQHLAKLRNLGFVQDTRQGKWVFYSLRIEDPVMKMILETIAGNTQQYPNLSQDIRRLAKLNHAGCQGEINE
ncbi:metalloregulator ArsR/SmtB family transcription factor [Sporomusa sphaeroides DSM 2875]|uniref:ArsR/SmtB family transcription factor n=1 Tax=Sporomusa sphaeroides TaxID=47679 RepID=UPI0020300304|nr:metalloregulator ArsR/SmtB family transcription factor [Sporomusa sphaeroides]MCM0761507.1 metalloregulator ArsR/SmtB family transcription factor [Sporomusa sphaeroides DSM 2875]